MPYRRQNVNINRDTDGTVFYKLCFKLVVHDYLADTSDHQDSL